MTATPRKISEMPPATVIADADLLPIVDVSESSVSSKNKKVTVGQILASLPDGAITSGKIADGAIVNADVNAAAGIVASKLSFTQAGSGAAARTVDSKLKDIVSVKDFGAVGDGVADDTVAVDAAFTYCGAQGKKCFTPSGTYLLSNTVVWPITSGFEVECEAGAVFKATAEVPVDSKLFLPSAVSGSQRFVWRGGTIDGRLMPARSAGAPDLLYISTPNINDVTITGVSFICNNTRSGTAGDSCLFLAEGEDYRITGCTFKGAVDAAVYTSGNGAQTTGRNCIVSDNSFIECNVGYIAKRLFLNQTISNNICRNCTSAIVVGGETDGTLLPGSKAIIANNVITRSGSVAIEARLANGTVIIGNRIEDYALDASLVPIIGYGILLQGSSQCVVSGNNISYTNTYTPDASSRAVYIIQRIYNSVTYSPINNLIAGNVIRRAGRGIAEGTGANSTIISCNNLADVTTRYTIVGANTILEDINQADRRTTKRFGTSGATATAGVHELVENSVGHLSQVLVPNTGSWQLLMGDNDSATVARQTYDHSVDRWQWRAGGSAVVFQIDSDGPRWGTRTATSDVTITGFINIRDEAGITRKLAIID
jgi:hypothetical protein